MIQSDEQLLSLCKAGDETAWKTLVERYQRLVYTVPRRAGLDEDQASEVFQEVFTVFFEKLHDIKHPDHLRAWFVTTARRKTWRVIERAKNMVSIHNDDEDEEGLGF